MKKQNQLNQKQNTGLSIAAQQQIKQISMCKESKAIIADKCHQLLLKVKNYKPYEQTRVKQNQRNINAHISIHAKRVPE